MRAVLGASRDHDHTASDALEGVVVLHVQEDGSFDLKAWGAKGVQLLWVDERSPGDRVYCQTHREDDVAGLRKLLGSDKIGHAGDGHLDEQTIQAIRAMAWRLEGRQWLVLSSASPAEGESSRDEPFPPPTKDVEP